MSTEITVRGSFSALYPAERGTVQATIAYQGSGMESVFRRAAADFDAVKRSIEAIERDGPVTWWSADQLRTWSEKPWHKDGKQLPLVHHARVGLQVKFGDFVALSGWVADRTTGVDGFRVSQVDWALTSRRRAELLAQARLRAVKDAADRAQVYADALGLGAIRPVAIADAGMLGEGLHPASVPGGNYLRAAKVSAAQEVQLVPEDIEVSADVDARFVVEG